MLALTKKLVLKMAVVIVLSLFTTGSHANQEDDSLLLYIPSLVAAFQCESDEFEACDNPSGCGLINGVWEDNLCRIKTSEQLNTELFIGKWFLVTSFSNGDFFNYIEFNKRTVESIRASSDFLIKGASHSTDEFNDPQANDTVATYDSQNDDWFILDFWGRDVGTISSIEVNRTSDVLFTGCEFYLNYPDLTYQDGICNPVRMTKNRSFKTASSGILARRVSGQLSPKLTSQNLQRTPGAAFRSTVMNQINLGEDGE